MLEALEMAVWPRRPRTVIHHADQGSQHASIAFGSRCKREGVWPSMGSVGDCYDNAMCESFFATLECELIDRVRLRTPREAKRAVFEWIEGWYNPRRRHSSLGYLAPAEFERRAAAGFEKPAGGGYDDPRGRARSTPLRGGGRSPHHRRGGGRITQVFMCPPNRGRSRVLLRG